MGTAPARASDLRRALGVLASLAFPGFGHLFIGGWRRSLGWYSTYAVVLLLAPFSIWPMLAWATVIRLAAALDVAFHRPNTPTVPKLRFVFAGWLCLGALTIALSSGCRLFLVESFKTPSASMAPTLLVGDHFFVNKYDKAPVRGDVVAFAHPCDPPRAFVKRVVALEGDRVELRCGQLYLNGDAIAREVVEVEYSYWDYAYENGWVQNSCSRSRETIDDKSYQVACGRLEPADASFDFPNEQPPSCMNSFFVQDASAQASGTIESAQVKSSEPCGQRMHYIVPANHFFVLGDNRENSSDSRAWGAVPMANLKGIASYIWWSKSPTPGTRWNRVGLEIE